MIIPINDRYRIASDKHAWMIQEAIPRKDKAGNPVIEWRAFLWYSDIQKAVNGLAERMIRTSEAEGIAEAMEEVKTVCAALSKALKPKFTVTHDG